MPRHRGKGAEAMTEPRIDTWPAKIFSKVGVIVLLAFAIASAVAVLLPIVDPFAVNISSVKALSVVAGGAVALLVVRLATMPIYQTLWVWIILAVLIIGCVMKSYRYWSNPNSYEFMSRHPDLEWVSSTIILAGARWIAAALITVSLTCWVALWYLRKRLKTAPTNPDASAVSTQAATILGAAVLAGSLIAGVAQAVLGIGILGTEGRHLPFRIDTLITRFLNDASPTLFLLVLWSLDQPRTRTRWALMGLALVAVGGLVGVISASRGALMHFGLPVVFLWLLSRRLTRPRLLLIVSGALIVLLLVPYISTLRIVQADSSQGLVEDVGVAIDMTHEVGVESRLLSSLDFVIMRVIGAEGVWYSIVTRPDDFSPARLYDLAIRDRVGVYYTLEIVRETRPATYRAPGLIGVFMLLGGNGAVVMALLSVYIIAAAFLWAWLASFRTAPVVMASGAKFVLDMTSDGTMDFRNVIAFLAVVLLCEWLYRSWLVRPKSTATAKLDRWPAPSTATPAISWRGSGTDTQRSPR